MDINPLKIGKYTFWTFFIIGSVFMSGGIITSTVPSLRYYLDIFVVGGYLYLVAAIAINILILILLLLIPAKSKENRKNYLKGIGYILLNIPIAAIYVYVAINFL